jgi:hypothetical protein
MQYKILGTASLLVIVLTLSGCKEDKDDLASPNCASPITSNDSSKCPRNDGNITRSKPQTWSMDSEKN